MQYNDVLPYYSLLVSEIYLEVLDSERSLFSAELEASAARRESLTSVVRLYQALGGGWLPAKPEDGEDGEAAASDADPTEEVENGESNP